MIQSPDKKYQSLIEKVYSFKQEQVFRFWDELSDSEKKELLRQIQTIDFELMSKLSAQAIRHSSKKTTREKLDEADIISMDERLSDEAESLQLGEDLLQQGKIAAFLVAGGQGTRLGFDGPKGMYPVTPVKKKSLFQLHAEKLIATGKKFGKEIPWFIMTSETNHQQTIDFFKENDFFNYKKDCLTFFSQEMIPGMDQNGKFILDAKNHIFTNPNGHGGSISALWNSGAIEKMQSNKIEYIFYFQVDNVLANICDPVYLGYHVKHKSQMSNKVVRKAYPEEKMGVICKINGKTGLIEYSDLSKEDMYAKNSDGSLKYWGGNIAIHIFNLDFIVKENEGGFRLPYHIANKAIPFLDENGRLINPEEPNGIKFEAFVFDALLDTEQSISLEVERSKEFSPLKNKDGLDSPETVHRDLCNLYGGWFENVGNEVPRDEEGNVPIDVEVSPLYALHESEFKNKYTKAEKLESGFYIE
jgi:UDP-N-acetylglucosamine/UDP-N-acetylgalactosamine diphosphorylase